MKRVVYLTHRFPVVTETFTTAEVEGLAVRGLDLEVCALRPAAGPGRAVEARGIPRRLSLRGLARSTPLLRTRSSRRWIAALRGAALAAAVDPLCDHLHAQFPLEAASTGLFAARASGASFSFAGHTYHDLDLMPEKLAAARFVVVGSSFERDLLLGRYGEEWSSKIHLRRLGVPERPARSSFRPGLVVAVGTLTGKKGHDVLVRAVAALAREGIAVELEIVGDGPDKGSLESLVASLGLEDRVRFLGSLAHEPALERIREACVFALCCRRTDEGDHDCLPVALMDAMSMAVPCVSSDAFGIPELIEDGVSGLLARPGDADGIAERIGRILGDGDRAAALGAAGRDAVLRDYRLERNLDRLAELFRAELA